MVPPVVDLAWLAERRDVAVVADVRWYLDGRSGRAAYDEGHLPGAVFVDLEAHLTGQPGPDRGRHPLPAPDAFAAAMGGLGIGDGTPVVAYDDQGGIVAARLVWMLRSLGEEAALLDGGLGAGDGPLVRSQPAIASRSLERFRGDSEPVDARAGHIPGAQSLPCTGNLAPGGRFLSPGRLRQRFEAAGVHAGSSVVAYCGSGVSACHDLLALELAELGKGRLYPGSWSHYSQVLDRPVETGER